MRVHESRFRPWLDDPGAWDVWQLDADELSGIRVLLKDAGTAAAHVVYARYGSQAELFDSLGFVKRLAAEPPSVEALFHIALAILAHDCYRARVAVPRPDTGGSTNPVNRKRWTVLREYLLQRLHDFLQTNAEGSLAARAISSRIPEDGLPTGQISRRLRRQVEESGLFAQTEFTLELRPRLAGGRRWLQAETVRALRDIEASLGEGRPVLVELLRDPDVSPASAQIVVVYRLEDSEDGWLTLTCYDPSRGKRPVALRLRSSPQALVVYDTGADQDSPAVKGIRLVTLAEATPPLFGLKRYTRWMLPWPALWRLARSWSLTKGDKQNSRKEAG